MFSAEVVGLKGLGIKPAGATKAMLKIETPQFAKTGLQNELAVISGVVYVYDAEVDVNPLSITH